MTRGLFVRYQELIGLFDCEANKDGIDAHVPCIDVLIPIEEFSSSFMECESAECLLNGMGIWFENGYTEKGDTLLSRVYKVVSGANYEKEKDKLFAIDRILDFP